MNIEERDEWLAFTDEILAALLADGSDPKATYTIEHHLVGDDFDMLEKAAVDAFKAGFEVTDAEEMELEDGDIVLCFDAVIERPLDREALVADLDNLLQISDKNEILYDGWGTEFIEPNH